MFSFFCDYYGLTPFVGNEVKVYSKDVSSEIYSEPSVAKCCLCVHDIDRSFVCDCMRDICEECKMDKMVFHGSIYVFDIYSLNTMKFIRLSIEKDRDYFYSAAISCLYTFAKSFGSKRLPENFVRSCFKISKKYDCIMDFNKVDILEHEITPLIEREFNINDLPLLIIHKCTGWFGSDRHQLQGFQSISILDWFYSSHCFYEYDKLSVSMAVVRIIMERYPNCVVDFRSQTDSPEIKLNEDEIAKIIRIIDQR